MYHQVGTLNRNDVNLLKKEKLWAVENSYPKIAITDADRVIEVHEGTYLRHVFYNVGPLNHKCVQWQHRPMYLSPGRFPVVAVHGNRVVVTHNKVHFQYSTFYRVGIINEGGTAIEWGDKLQLFEVSRIAKTTIAINEEFAVAAGQGWSKPRLVCRLGRFPNGDAGGCAILFWQSSFS